MSNSGSNVALTSEAPSTPISKILFLGWLLFVLFFALMAFGPFTFDADALNTARMGSNVLAIGFGLGTVSLLFFELASPSHELHWVRNLPMYLRLGVGVLCPMMLGVAIISKCGLEKLTPASAAIHPADSLIRKEEPGTSATISQPPAPENSYQTITVSQNTYKTNAFCRDLPASEAEAVLALLTDAMTHHWLLRIHAPDGMVILPAASIDLVNAHPSHGLPDDPLGRPWIEVIQPVATATTNTLP